MKTFISAIIALIFCLSASGQAVYKSKIIGKWQSTEDNRSFLIFTPTKQISIYTGIVSDTALYQISGDTLIVNAPNDDFKYELMTLDNKHLSMMYLVRGNVLSFTRVVPKKRKKK